MIEEDNKDSKVKSTIDAVTGLVKAVPVYQDAVQPAAKEIGKSLETVTKAVNLALAPIKALVWGYDKIETFISNSISKKLENIPAENIQTPPPHIAGPAVESLRFVGHDENLRELYSNLLANAMDKGTSMLTHPSFVELLKNFSPEEALVMQSFIKESNIPKINIEGTKEGEVGSITYYKNFTSLHHTYPSIDINKFPLLLDNLKRLGLLEIISDAYFILDKFYEPLENDGALVRLKNQIESSDRSIKFKRGIIELTKFGKDFVKVVIEEKK